MAAHLFVSGFDSHQDHDADHEPIGSTMFMQRNAPWGNRVVGSTTELHFAENINPNTLEVYVQRLQTCRWTRTEGMTMRPGRCKG